MQTACSSRLPGCTAGGTASREGVRIPRSVDKCFFVVSGPDPRNVVKSVVAEIAEDSLILKEGEGSTVETHLQESISPSSPVLPYQQWKYPQQGSRPPHKLICEV